MEPSTARIEANRRNAQQSTGPKTAEGKARSRQNALKHGLTATVLDPELAAIEPPSRGDDHSNPSWIAWLGEQVTRVRVQIVRSQRIESKLRDLAAWRAATCWDADRRVTAEDQGVSLRREPGRTVGKLRQTPQGCDWLSERWAALARAAEVNQTWSDDQVRLAFDLLSTPAEGRVGTPGSTLNPQHDAGQSILDLARAAITELAEHRLLAAEADELEQILAEGDCRDTPTPELARLRRYELALHKRLQWLITELRDHITTPDAITTPEPAPAVTPQRNEPIPPTSSAETKPTQAEPNATNSPETSRLRPDLTRLVQQNRHDRRRDRRNHRSA